MQCYVQTNDVEKEAKDTFYQQLQKALDDVPSHDILLVVGDLNAEEGSVLMDFDVILVHKNAKKK